ncbi:MAG: hypothetical protein J07AB43_05940, partial [Candidatus Nanosalina sp. J07AB43]
MGFNLEFTEIVYRVVQRDVLRKSATFLACCIFFGVSGSISAEKIYLEGNTLGADENTVGTLSTPNRLSAQEDGYKYMVMQYKEPSEQEYRNWMGENGVEFISYIPEDSWLIKINTSKEWLSSEKKVERVIPYKSKYRIDPSFKDRAAASTGTLNARIKFFKPARKSQQILNNYTDSYSKISPKFWKIEVTPEDIYQLSQESAVKYIYPETPEFETKNDDSRAL